MDKILTLNHLKNRGWNLANMCIMGMKEEESVDHIFIQCLLMRKSSFSPILMSLGFFHFSLLISSQAGVSGIRKVFQLAFGTFCQGLYVGTFGKKEE